VFPDSVGTTRPTCRHRLNPLSPQEALVAHASSLGSLPDASTAPNGGRPSLPPSLDGSGDGDSAVEGTGGSALSLDYGFRSDAVDGHQ
jgi:hypothetical protein